jgi:hypothetical protein
MARIRRQNMVEVIKIFRKEELPLKQRQDDRSSGKGSAVQAVYLPMTRHSLWWWRSSTLNQPWLRRVQVDRRPESTF